MSDLKSLLSFGAIAILGLLLAGAMPGAAPERIEMKPAVLPASVVAETGVPACATRGEEDAAEFRRGIACEHRCPPAAAADEEKKVVKIDETPGPVLQEPQPGNP